jgi:hypothetical protein
MENKSITVDEIRSRYFVASGGDSIYLINTEIRTGKLVRGGAGAVPLRVEIKYPDKYLYNQKFAWGDQVSYGINSTTSWIQTTKDVNELPPGFLLDMEIALNTQLPVKIREYFTDLQVERTENTSERMITVLSGNSKDGLKKELHFDNNSGLLIRAGDIVFDNYITQDNVKIPNKILLGLPAEDNTQIKMEFSKIQLNSDIDDHIFDIPVCPLSVIESPLYKTRTHFKPTIDELEKCVGVYTDQKNENYKWFVSREDGHLFIFLKGWSLKQEIIPESSTDYYTEFLGWEFHFKPDSTGKICELIINANFEIKTKRTD